jgi:hypothetical protein
MNNLPDPYFPPSAVRLEPIPLLSTFDRSEQELAAALIVRCCQVSGDWHPVPPGEVGRVIKADIEAGNEPFASISRNIFLSPDVWSLVANRHACWTGKPGGEVEFTAQGFERLRRWVAP